MFQSATVAILRRGWGQAYLNDLTTTIFGTPNPKWSPSNNLLWNRLRWDEYDELTHVTTDSQDLLKSYDVTSPNNDDSEGALDSSTNAFLSSRVTPPNVEISCTYVFKFFCVDTKIRSKITQSQHFFFTNYDFLCDMHANHKDFLFIPVTFIAAYFRDFLPKYYSGCGHAAFIFVDTTRNILAYYDSNYIDADRHIYDRAIYYAAEQIGKVWGRKFTVRDSTDPHYYEQIKGKRGGITLKKHDNDLCDLFPYMTAGRGDCAFSVAASACLLYSSSPREVSDIVGLIKHNRRVSLDPGRLDETYTTHTSVYHWTVSFMHLMRCTIYDVNSIFQDQSYWHMLHIFGYDDDGLCN